MNGTDSYEKPDRYAAQAEGTHPVDMEPVAIVDESAPIIKHWRGFRLIVGNFCAATPKNRSYPQLRMSKFVDSQTFRSTLSDLGERSQNECSRARYLARAGVALRAINLLRWKH